MAIDTRDSVRRARPDGSSRRKVEVEGREETKVVELPGAIRRHGRKTPSFTSSGQRAFRVDAMEKVTGRRGTPPTFSASRHAARRDSARARRARARDCSTSRPRSRVDGVATSLATPSSSDASTGQRRAVRHDHLIRRSAAGRRLRRHARRRAARGGRHRRAVRGQPHVGSFDAAVAEGAPAVRVDRRRAASNDRPDRQPAPRLARRRRARRRRTRPARGRRRRHARVSHAGRAAHRARAARRRRRVDRRTPHDLGIDAGHLHDATRGRARRSGLPRHPCARHQELHGRRLRREERRAARHVRRGRASRKLGRPVRCMLDREGEQTRRRQSPSHDAARHARRQARRNAHRHRVRGRPCALGVGGWQASRGEDLSRAVSLPERAHRRDVRVHEHGRDGVVPRARARRGRVRPRVRDGRARRASSDMDPLELRRRNYAERRSGQATAVLEQAISTSAIGRAPSASGGQRARSAAARPVACGAASAWRRSIWGAGGGPPAYATVRINGDGTIEVLTGAQDLGTGARTVIAQIAAEVARREDRRRAHVLGDTERLPFASNSWGSITTASVGPAVRVAAEEARDSLFEAAAEVLDVDASTISSARQRDLARGRRPRASRSARLRQARRRDDHRAGQPRPESRQDGDRGVRRAVRRSRGRRRDRAACACCASSSAHDCGRIINPTLAESQLEGGIIQGLGYALFEERVLDGRLGVPLNRDDARLQDSDDRRRAARSTRSSSTCADAVGESHRRARASPSRRSSRRRRRSRMRWPTRSAWRCSRFRSRRGVC